MPPLVEGKERKPTILIVHGANHQPEHFTRLTTALETAGYKVRVPPLPSTHKLKKAVKDLAADIDAVQAVIEDEISMHNDIVVVAHSYGGVPASSAARRLDKASKARQHNKAGVSRFVYVAAFLPDKDEALAARRPKALGLDADAEAAPSPEAKLEKGFYTPAPEEARATFYNRQSKEDADWALGLIKPFSVAVLKDTLKWEPWKNEVPCTYIWCTDDKVLSNELQGDLTKGRGMDIVKLDADHSPFIDQADFLSKVVRKYAGEDDVDIGEVSKS